ncbi:hypothetical protein XENOCAPTIV_024662 [Xenoophorus captivus]|uniref:Uncharacterized protein n=1 Tax=Xenoophorus captivus TaxID=1517983 RepID=A0ABV0S5Z7_9TELE
MTVEQMVLNESGRVLPRCVSTVVISLHTHTHTRIHRDFPKIDGGAFFPPLSPLSPVGFVRNLDECCPFLRHMRSGINSTTAGKNKIKIEPRKKSLPARARRERC